MSGIVTLPLLTIIHTVQYVQYLQQTGIAHADFLRSLRSGGAQGFCAGLMAAMIVAVSKDETELIANAAKAVRIAFVIGAFGEIGCDSTSLNSTTMVVRLKSGSEVEDITREFPESYVSAISDSKTISLIAPSSEITTIRVYVEKLGLSSKMIHMRSNIHNPKNRALAEELLGFCLGNADFQLPHSDDLQVPVRSNRTGQVLSNCSLTAEIITTILTSCCDWNTIINNLAHDLQQTGNRSHRIAMIGLGDCIPLPPFQKHNLDITKLDIMCITEGLKKPLRDYGLSSLDLFPPNSIAVVGAACRLPGANTLEELWELISRGESRLESLREDRVKLTESFRASQDKDWTTGRNWFGNFVDGIDEFDHSFFGISPKEAAYMDPQQRLLLSCAYEAMDASGYLHNHRRENGDPVGCFIGASYTEYCENVTAYAPSAFAATGTIRAFLSGKISYHFGWTGPSEVIDTACSASLVAIHHACRAIQAGDCAMALAGGVNIITGIQNYIDLGRAGFLSKSGQCKPFDESADGYCRADGVGLVVLKPLSQAVADRNHILGVIPASATNQGGLSHGITVPHGVAQQALYRQIVKAAGIEPEQVTYVESHGTGTQVGDPIEVTSIREVFGRPSRPSPVHIGSLKANVGHSETAAGVASLLKVLAMFAHRGIPPQAGFKTLNPKIPALEPDNLGIATMLIPWEAKSRIACVNSYGASGSNAALICSEWNTGSEKLKMSSSSSYPVFLSANTQEALRANANRLASYLQNPEQGLSIGSVAFTLSERRKHHRIRWSTTAHSLSDLTHQLKSDLVNSVEIPKARRRVVLAFSGQSKTKIGLDPSLCDMYPKFRAHLESCNYILRNLGYSDIMSSLCQSEAVTDVVTLHAGTFAVQYACARCWLDGGLQVDAVIGHSLGELTALAVSGVLSLEDALRLVAKRGSLIKEKWGPDTGAMLAIYADLEIVQRIIADSGTEFIDDEVEIACYNSPTAHIVAGKKSSIVRVERIINDSPEFNGIRYQGLDVSHGFHSKLTEPLLPDLIEFAKTLTFNEPRIPLETSTKMPVSEIAPTYIAEHSRHGVYFSHAVQRLESRLGPCVWLEAGWHTPVISMTKKALQKTESHSFQSLSGSSSAVTTVAASLWKQGISVTWWGFFSSEESKLRHVWLPPCTFDNSRHWLDHVDRAIELQQSQAPAQGINGGLTPQSTQLVSFVGRVGRDDEFRLHTRTEKYKNMVTGHALRQRPLCPASMYMESAVMCAQERGADFEGQTFHFRKIGFHSGLGCDDRREVRVVLGENTGAESWRFSVNSTAKEDPKAPKTKHADGHFEVSVKAPDYRIYEALILERMESLLKDRNAEHLMKRTAYALFSRVIEYSDLLKGISSITLAPGQAVAEIEVPEETLDSRESTVDRFMDAISLDTFIQVLGLLINTSGKSAGDEVFVATSIANMTILPCDFKSHRRWAVYAMFSMDGDKRAVGDVFVFSGDRKLVVFGSQISFTKVQSSVLEALLDGTSPRVNMAKARNSETGIEQNRAPLIAKKEPSTTQTLDQRTTIDNSFSEESQKFNDVKVLIASYVGISASDIHEDESFSSLGLDSLSAVELVDELRVKFGIDISAGDILTAQVAELRNNLLSNGKESSATTNSRSAMAGELPKSTNGDKLLTNGLAAEHEDRHESVNGYANGNATEYTDCHLTNAPKPRHIRHRIETVTYKEVDGIEIAADIFIPLEPPLETMPIDDSLRMGKEYQPRTMSMNEIQNSLRAQVVTSHAFNSTDTTNMGWVQPGDPRSELVLALVKEKNGVALLLDGIPTNANTLGVPEPERVAAISPLAQVQNGNYHTPTFVIIGDEDEIVPFHTSVDFVNALREQGIKNGFIPVPGQRHIYDLALSPGMAKWDDWVAPGYKFLFEILGIDSG
ncbi:hypothetical protein ACHAPE_001517 [Trichoderma viride]